MPSVFFVSRLLGSNPATSVVEETEDILVDISYATDRKVYVADRLRYLDAFLTASVSSGAGLVQANWWENMWRQWCLLCCIPNQASVRLPRDQGHVSGHFPWDL